LTEEWQAFWSFSSADFYGGVSLVFRDCSAHRASLALDPAGHPSRRQHGRQRVRDYVLALLEPGACAL
jgi:hypothetical protein